MKNIIPLFCIALIFADACGPTAKVTTDKDYADSVAIKSVFVIVVTDAATKDCMNYYQHYLVDSLKSYGINAQGTFFCCRDKKTDIQAIMDSIAPGTGSYQNILGIVMSKVVTGYGTSSERELQLMLFNEEKHMVTWKGKLSANFSWFISDANYQAVAHKMTKTTLESLRYQQIIPQ
jgi:hypothetical protein